MAGANYNASSSPIFERLKILKLVDIHKLHLGVFVHGVIQKYTPRPLQNIYDYHGDIHEHNTRRRADPRPPNAHYDVFRRSFMYTGPSTWLTFGDHLKSSKTKQQFAKRLLSSY